MSPPQRPRATILVVEDDPAMASALDAILESSGYQVWHAASGADAIMMLKLAVPDLVLLDLMLPDVDGLLLCGEIRTLSDVPIVVCSGAGERRDIVLSLRLGADDFIAKPFDVNDLEARVEAVLRRARHSSPVEREPKELRVGALSVNLSHPSVRLGGEEIHPTPAEYRILSVLVSRPDQVVSRAELARAVWGYEDSSANHAIDSHVSRLRVKLSRGPVQAPELVTVRGFGFKISSRTPSSASSAA